VADRSCCCRSSVVVVVVVEEERRSCRCLGVVGPEEELSSRIAGEERRKVVVGELVEKKK